MKQNIRFMIVTIVGILFITSVAIIENKLWKTYTGRIVLPITITGIFVLMYIYATIALKIIGGTENENKNQTKWMATRHIQKDESARRQSKRHTNSIPSKHDNNMHRNTNRMDAKVKTRKKVESMNSIQKNINVGMAITQSIRITTIINDGRNRERTKQQQYEDILKETEELIPKVLKIINKTREKEGL